MRETTIAAFLGRSWRIQRALQDLSLNSVFAVGISPVVAEGQLAALSLLPELEQAIEQYFCRNEAKNILCSFWQFGLEQI